jgi:hypothetical protein
MKMAVRMSKTSENLIDEQRRIAAFWMTGNKTPRLAERFVAAIETLEDRGILDHDFEAHEVSIEILEQRNHQDP